MHIAIPKSLTRILAIAALPLVIWLLLPFLLPARGLDRAWSRLIDAIAERDTATLQTLLADDYRDGFGLDRDQAIHLLDQAARQFITLNIRRERPRVHIESARLGTTEALLRVSGQGTPLAPTIARGSRTLDTPTSFRWRRLSWKPWDWQLTSVDNPRLRDDIARLRRQLERFERESGGINPLIP